MQTIGKDQVQNHQLRIVFDETVVSLRVSGKATFEDVARMLGKHSQQRYGRPAGICVTLSRPSGTPPSEMPRWVPNFAVPSTGPRQYAR